MGNQIRYWIQKVLTSCAEIERYSLHMQHARDLYGDEQHSEQSCWQMNSLVPHGRWEVSDIDRFNGEILRVFKANMEMLEERKTEGLYQLESSVQTGEATVSHGFSEVWPDTSGASSTGCPEKSSEEGDKVDFEELYIDGGAAAEMSLFHSRFD
ncbi:hypothetical protein Acr_27g0009110 [Actinidia rufa]|uniref:Uncharacterized protein n=1 Tax=Actinidia rufa TaxID=165716 RepID=A0A7J0H7T9_9ERIC|nr:hypothetical protein Acr_27g0009110 [Actinidia rufa]